MLRQAFEGAFVLALGCFVTVGHASAAGHLKSDGLTPLAVEVADEGIAIEQMERPNEVPAGSQEQATPENATPPPPTPSGSKDPEVQELKSQFPSTDWPTPHK
jgi:hypothetical protein